MKGWIWNWPGVWRKHTHEELRELISVHTGGAWTPQNKTTKKEKKLLAWFQSPPMRVFINDNCTYLKIICFLHGNRSLVEGLFYRPQIDIHARMLCEYCFSRRPSRQSSWSSSIHITGHFSYLVCVAVNCSLVSSNVPYSSSRGKTLPFTRWCTSRIHRGLSSWTSYNWSISNWYTDPVNHRAVVIVGKTETKEKDESDGISRSQMKQTLKYKSRNQPDEHKNPLSRP